MFSPDSMSIRAIIMLLFWTQLWEWHEEDQINLYQWLIMKFLQRGKRTMFSEWEGLFNECLLAWITKLLLRWHSKSAQSCHRQLKTRLCPISCVASNSYRTIHICRFRPYTWTELNAGWGVKLVKGRPIVTYWYSIRTWATRPSTQSGLVEYPFRFAPEINILKCGD